MIMSYRVQYNLVLVIAFLLTACSSVTSLAKRNLNGDMSAPSLGILVLGEYWVELFDDLDTTFPFDMAVWKNKSDGYTDYKDIVSQKGVIVRYNRLGNSKKFAVLETLEVDPFVYIYNVFEYHKVPW